MSVTIGVDIGGTKVAAGAVDTHGQLLQVQRRATPANSAQATLDAIIDVIETLTKAQAEQGTTVEAVGLAAAGFVDEKRATVVHAPNVAGWQQEPLRQRVSQRIPLPVVVENDANAAAWAEANYGAGRGQRFLACVTVGTGIGGGLVLDGQLMRGQWGFAAEFGHIEVVVDGHHCGCGKRGCWEQYASGSALVRLTRARAVEQREQAHQLLLLGDGTPEGITGQHVTQAARQADEVALASFTEVGTWLGRGLATLSAILDPGCFVIGGGVCEAGDLLLEPARRAYERNLSAASVRPLAPIVGATLGNEAGIVGAACLARVR